jgi:hypothetical protein
MISKILKVIYKEITNIADLSPVTFNATGSYDPRYGKQHIKVSGKGQDGTYAAGTDYYNTSPGTAYYNYVAGTAYYNYVAGTAYYNYVAGTANYNYVAGTAYYNYVAAVYTPGNYYFSGRFLFRNPPTYTPASYPYAGTNAASYPYAGTNAASYPYAGTNAATYPYAGTNPATYPYAGTNPATYPYAGTNPAVTNTGASTNVLGVAISGGYGTASTVIPPTESTIKTRHGTPVPVTVPTGGYVTLTFTL